METYQKGTIIAVSLPLATGGTYDYRVGDDELSRGDVVRVPLGRREVWGIVWGPGTSDLPPAKIRAVIARVPTTGLSPEMIDFINWTAQYTLSDLGAVLKLALPMDMDDPAPTPSKRGKPIGGTTPHPHHTQVVLTPAQMAAAQTLTAGVQARAYQTFVLDGVTGAGKTEVYFEAVAAALEAGRQVLIMIPEIALTTTFVERFEKRFGQAPAVWHSGLTPVQRKKTFAGIMDGTVRVVAGARSALMLPYPDLGLIVIDEEHDAAYKQEDGVMYNARDMAIARAHKFGFPIILASATPSMETTANIWAGRYTAVTLPGRFGAAQMPTINLIDLKLDKPEKGDFIAPKLDAAIVETLARKEQVLLFLNRRGYAPLTLCRSCGYRFMCPKCTSWMVAHRRTGRLHCHHCGHDQVLPKECPSCQTEGSFVACGPGVERIEEEVKRKYPDARTVILSSDITDNPNELAGLLTDIEQGRVDVVIGTQMIAKGHHFPGLTLVGVVDADLGLSGGDLRAAERTFQLLQQVAGRAGRADKPGTVYLQTYMPDNKVMLALRAGARDQFLEIEAAERQAAGMPPFTRLVAVIIAGADEATTKNCANTLARNAPHGPGVTTWGPAEAPIYRIRGKYRFRLLIQADRQINIQKSVAEWISSASIPSSVDVRVDVDPQTFF